VASAAFGQTGLGLLKGDASPYQRVSGQRSVHCSPQPSQLSPQLPFQLLFIPSSSGITFITTDGSRVSIYYAAGQNAAKPKGN